MAAMSGILLLAVAWHPGWCNAELTGGPLGVRPIHGAGQTAAREVTRQEPGHVLGLVPSPSEMQAYESSHAIAPGPDGMREDMMMRAMKPGGPMMDMRMMDMHGPDAAWANSPGLRANAFYIHDLRSPINAADLFQPPGTVLPYLLITTRVAGANILPVTQTFRDSLFDVLSTLYCVNFNITLDLLSVDSSRSANFTSSVGPEEKNVTYDPRFRNYNSVDLRIHLQVGFNSSLPAWGSNMREMTMTLQKGMAKKGFQVRFLAHIWTRLLPTSIPILANIPPMVSQGFRFIVQMTGNNLFPFNVQRQTLFTEVIFSLIVTRTGLYEVTLLNIAEAAGDDGKPDFVRIDMCMAQAGGVGHLDQIIQWVFNNGDTSALAGAATLSAQGRRLRQVQTAFTEAMANSGLPIIGANLTELRPTHNASFSQQLNNALQPVVVDLGPVALGQNASGSGPRSTPILTIALATIFGALVFAIILGGGLFAYRHFAGNPQQEVDCEDPKKATGKPKALGTRGRLSDDSAAAAHSCSFKKVDSLPSSTNPTFSLASDALADHVKLSEPRLKLSPDSDSLMERREARGWELDASDITICQRPDGSDWMLGKGGGGMVFKGLRCGVQDVAVKIMLQVSATDLKQFNKEVAILKSLSFDKNVVQFYGACVGGPCPLLILEYMEGGDLWDALDNHRDKMQFYALGRRIALDVARGLHFLHHHKVRHGDLKTKNILLTGDLMTAKIADVGMAKVMHSNTTNRADGGTFAYAAPELLFNQRCDEKADIYSFGVVLHEICTLDRPERGGMRPIKVPEEAPQEIVDLIHRCLATSPDRRPTARELFDVIRSTEPARSGSGECDSVVDSTGYSGLGSPIPSLAASESAHNSVVFADMTTGLGRVQEELDGSPADSLACPPPSCFANAGSVHKPAHGDTHYVI